MSAAIRISSTSGRVRVRAADRDDVLVEGDASIAADDGLTTVKTRSEDVTVTVPVGTDVTVGSASGRIDIGGNVGAIAINTGSGRVTVDAAVTVDARSMSGRITIGTAAGECRVRSVSGRVDVGACGSVDASTTSGRLSLRGVLGPARVHSVSGGAVLEMEVAAPVEVETVSGRIKVSFPSGMRFREVAQARVPDAPHDDGEAVVAVSSGAGRIDVTNR